MISRRLKLQLREYIIGMLCRDVRRKGKERMTRRSRMVNIYRLGLRNLIRLFHENALWFLSEGFI